MEDCVTNLIHPDYELYFGPFESSLRFRIQTRDSCYLYLKKHVIATNVIQWRINRPSHSQFKLNFVTILFNSPGFASESNSDSFQWHVCVATPFDNPLKTNMCTMTIEMCHIISNNRIVIRSADDVPGKGKVSLLVCPCLQWILFMEKRGFFNIVSTKKCITVE